MEKIFVNRDACDGCNNCVNMCASIHSAPRIKIIEHDSAYYSLVCQHCENAPCVKICPTNAMTTKGVKTEDCIGCGLCSIVCPFGAITIAESVAEKCDLCAEIKIKNQEKYLAKLAGEYDIGSTSNRSFVHFITSAARARLALDE